MSFLTHDTADDIITSLEIIEKLLFPETDFWHDNYLKAVLAYVSTSNGCASAVDLFKLKK